MKNIKNMYFSKNTGDLPTGFEINGIKYILKENLRYGTNPHQPASLYVQEQNNGVIGGYNLCKEGKSGLSQTNIEDVNYAVNILKFFNSPGCAVMKHLNPSGVCVTQSKESLKEIYIKARDCDPQAAFGSTVVFNSTIDEDVAAEIMQTIVENVAAPGFSDDALRIFNDFEKFKRNKQIRIMKIGDINTIPKYIGENFEYHVKSLQDGSIILEAPYLTKIKNKNDLLTPIAESKQGDTVKINAKTDDKIINDLLFAWYVCIGVRSNGIVIAKDGVTLAIGTGEQDRVGAVEQAISKAKKKFKGKETLKDSVIASDGFFPFSDSIELIAQEGIKGIIQPGGSVNDEAVINACNKNNILMYFTGERCFSHH